MIFIFAWCVIEEGRVVIILNMCLPFIQYEAVNMPTSQHVAAANLLVCLFHIPSSSSSRSHFTRAHDLFIFQIIASVHQHFILRILVVSTCSCVQIAPLSLYINWLDLLMLSSVVCLPNSWGELLIVTLSLRVLICVLLSYLNQFGHTLSPALWPWPKSVTFYNCHNIKSDYVRRLRVGIN